MRLASLLILLSACERQSYESGQSEPIRVREGTFHKGELPEGEAGPRVINAAGIGAVALQGQASLVYGGLASKDAFSVAVAFPTLGTGYWVVPVDGPDVTQDNNLLFQLTLDLTPEVPHGLQTVSFAAIDGHGEAGPRYELQLCVLPETANGSLSACDPEVTPPNAVISLSWDTQVDLDLVAVAPNGKVVSARAPTTAISDGLTIPGELVNDPTTGRLSRDSNGNCVIDGIRIESLVFPGEPPPGEYLLYARLNSACGRPYVNYRLTLHVRVDEEDGTHPVERTELVAGEMLAVQQSGEANLGILLTALELP